MRSWSNKAHLAQKNIHELRQFIQVRFSQVDSESCDSVVVWLSLQCVRFRIWPHGAKLQARKRLSVFSIARLNKEDRSFGVEQYKYAKDGSYPPKYAHDNDNGTD